MSSIMSWIGGLVLAILPGFFVMGILLLFFGRRTIRKYLMEDNKQLYPTVTELNTINHQLLEKQRNKK